MATNYTTIDASALSSIDYSTYLADYFAAMGTTTRGATTYYDSTYYASVQGYYTGSQVGVRYSGSTNNAQVVMEGEDMQYDGVDGVHHGSYSGSVDSVTFGTYDGSTTYAQIDGVARSTLIGVIEGLVVSGLDISEVVGAGSGEDNDFYQLMTALRDGNSTTVADGNTLTNGEIAIEKLYELFASKAQYFIGSDGDDTYTGTKFGDKIDAGTGIDTLSGGAGKDIFVFDLGDSSATSTDADVILDFSVRRDRIDLSAIDTNATKDGDQAFKFYGTGDLGSKAGISYEQVDGQTIVSIDSNGDATVDMTLVLDGSLTLTAGNFIL
jgi:Ca2+-binding RTX toxin-like protein